MYAEACGNSSKYSAQYGQCTSDELSNGGLQMNKRFQSAERYARTIQMMKLRNRKVGVRRLLTKIKLAIVHCGFQAKKPD